jgi:serine/threonine protein phosphatase PrpC
MRIDLAAVTHAGRVRPHNEDCIVAGGWLQNEPMGAPRVMQGAMDGPFVCMVLDGMGGQAAGEIASQEAGRHLARTLPACGDEEAVTEALRGANAHLYERMHNDRHNAAMGATVAGVRIAKEGVLVFNVGDSRVYRVQDGFLAQLSVDDIPARQSHRSGLVTQSLGGTLQFSDIVPHVTAQSPAPKTFLLCSDGLYDAVDLDQMEEAIDEDLGASAGRLLEVALLAGARDNVSLILVRIAD